MNCPPVREVNRSWFAVLGKDSMAGKVYIETNRSKIVARLKREGWCCIGGGRHDKFRHPEKPELLVIVPRHREVSVGVAHDIAKKVSW